MTSPKITEAKIRIEAKDSESLDMIVQEMRQIFDVLDESRDYPNRGNSGFRRYVTIKMMIH